jgi:hypothetical protein
VLFLEKPPVSILTVLKLGYWIVEPLVEQGEYYPKGGMRRLVCFHIPSDITHHSDRLQKEGLGWLKEAGIAAILDHHALPGVAADSQMFAGRCVHIPNSKKVTKLIPASKVHFGCPVLREQSHSFISIL